jgi:hypothetical protein
LFNNNCVACNIQNCQICQQSGVCFQCASLYQATSAGSCVLCNINNCQTCNNQNLC